jgi:hypothetical protein
MIPLRPVSCGFSHRGDATYDHAMDSGPVSSTRKALATVGKSTAGALRSGERSVGRFNRNAYVVLAVVILSVVGVVLAWLQYRHETAASGVADVTMVAPAENYTVSKFVLDASVDLTDLPAMAPDLYCQPEHVRWLHDHGTRIDPIVIELTNEGSGGEYARVSDLRFERHETPESSSPSFIFDCVSGGVADTLRADLTLGDTAAEDLVAARKGPETVPVAFNLAAGESAYLELGIHPAVESVSGDIVLEVAAGGEVGDRAVTREDGEQSFEIPGLGTQEPLFVSAASHDRVFYCTVGDEPLWACTATEVRQVAKQLAESSVFVPPLEASEKYAVPEARAIIEEFACHDARELGVELRDFVNAYVGFGPSDPDREKVGATEHSFLRTSITEVREACNTEYAADAARAMADTPGMSAAVRGDLLAAAGGGS